MPTRKRDVRFFTQGQPHDAGILTVGERLFGGTVADTAEHQVGRHR